jgi:hypothetical protein
MKFTAWPDGSGGSLIGVIVFVEGSYSTTSGPEADPHALVIQLHLIVSKMTFPFGSGSA